MAVPSLPCAASVSPCLGACPERSEWVGRGGCTFTQLDRYLWLRGQWRAYHAGEKPRARVNREVLPLFDTRPAPIAPLLDQAFPPV